MQIYLDDHWTVDAFLERESQDATRWHEQWRRAKWGAGLAPYLEDGSSHVEGIRCSDAEGQIWDGDVPTS